MIAWWQIILLTALAFWMILDQLTLVTINSPVSYTHLTLPTKRIV